MVGSLPSGADESEGNDGVVEVGLTAARAGVGREAVIQSPPNEPSTVAEERI